MAKQFTDDCVELVKEFEGLSLTAYLCPAGIWTIGYGRTEGVRKGDTCTEKEAEEYLKEDLEWANDAVNDYIRVSLNQSQHDGLTSFTYNVGSTALSESTLVKRLNKKQDPDTVISAELPRWVHDGNGNVLPGLVRRRNAEIALALKDSGQHIPEPLPQIKLTDAAKYYTGLDHQDKAWNYLEDLLTTDELNEFARLYRDDPMLAPDEPSNEIVLDDVKYFYQLDSATEYGSRMCASSTCAMLLEYEKPGTLVGPNADDQYLQTVLQYGDTTSAEAQVTALESYGLETRFVTNGDWDSLENHLKQGHPIAVGWLHHGNVKSPSGGGHWSLIVGITEDSVIVMDPNGEADLVNGGYVSNNLTAGYYVEYSKKNFGPRWMVEGGKSGWMIEVI